MGNGLAGRLARLERMTPARPEPEPPMTPEEKEAVIQQIIARFDAAQDDEERERLWQYLFSLEAVHRGRESALASMRQLIPDDIDIPEQEISGWLDESLAKFGESQELHKRQREEYYRGAR